MSQPKRASSIRLTPTDRTRIAARAAQADVDFSHMVRRMLAFADLHMPDGWVPAARRQVMDAAHSGQGHATGSGL